MKKLILVVAALCCMASSAQAIPTLQLDIAGGYYDSATQTIIAPGDSFTLYALLNASPSELSTNFFISAALTPQTTPPGISGSSFSFAGQNVNVTGDMVYGVPPLEAVVAKDQNDLGQHSIFETYFKEFQFNFDSTKTMSLYNTQDRAKSGGTIPTSGTGLYWMAFNVDTSLLAPGYGIHFDLYSEKLGKNYLGDLDVNQFAPFSHDAQSGPPVPEPGTIVLLGAGLIGLAIFGKRRMNKEA